MKQIQLKKCAPLIVGLALLWFSFHASPYYPFSLSPDFSQGGASAISGRHIAYTVAFVLALAGIYATLARKELSPKRTPVLFAAAAIAGFVGCALQMASPLFDGAQHVTLGISLALVALYAACALMAGFGAASRMKPAEAAFSVAASYCLFGVVWAAALLCGATALRIFSALCPLLAIPCFVVASRTGARPSAGSVSRSLSALPWSVVALCLVFIYFGVISVRAFTTMEMGGFYAGALGAAPQTITALAGTVICALLAWIFVSKDISPSTLVTAFATLALVYMAALLVVLLGDQTQGATLAGKRILVAAEHCVEVLLAIVLVMEAARRNISASLLSTLYGVAVLAIPQFITLDVMYQSGVLESLSHMSLVTPLAAVGAFAVAAACIVLLMRFSMRTAAQASTQADGWQEELCRQALAGHDITQREMNVAVLTYRGHSAKRIAEELLVSESTVKAHLTHIYRKLDVHTKQELIALIDGYRTK